MLENIEYWGDFMLHSYNMFVLGIGFSEALELSDKERKRLLDGILLHDIGKFTIKKEILYSSEMTKNQKEIVKTHPLNGFDMVKAKVGPDVLTCILFHHERWNGSGYPFGLDGEKIPYMSRIVALLDVYETMVSGRFYQEPKKKEEVLEFIEKEAGELFDPNLTMKFVEFMKKNDIEMQIGCRPTAKAMEVFNNDIK